jgi:hypothetical protein
MSDDLTKARIEMAELAVRAAWYNGFTIGAITVLLPELIVIIAWFFWHGRLI